MGTTPWCWVRRAQRARTQRPTEPFLAPYDGATLPPHPTLWLFSLEPEMPRIETDAPMRRGPVEVFGDLHVQRVELRAARGQVEVHMAQGPYFERTVTYTIDPAWAREATPALGPWAVSDFAWSCSFADELTAEVETAAAAFEVVLRDRRTVVPGERLHAFGPRTFGPSVLGLGHASCFGYTVAGGRPAIADVQEIWALYPDGSRVRLELPATPPPAPDVVEIEILAPEPPALEAAAPTPREVPWHAPALVVGFALAVFLARRARAPLGW